MISVRCNPEDEKLIKQYAEANNKTVSEFIREAALDKIEEEYDLKIVREYMAFKDKIKYFTSAEVDKELGL